MAKRALLFLFGLWILWLVVTKRVTAKTFRKWKGNFKMLWMLLRQ